MNDRLKIGGQPRDNYKVIDAISGATITMMVLNATVTRSMDSVARAQGFVDVFAVVSGVYELFLRDRLRQDYLATSGESQAQWMAG